MQPRQRNSSVAPSRKHEKRIFLAAVGGVVVAFIAAMATAFGGIATIIGAIIQINPQWSLASKEGTLHENFAAAPRQEASGEQPIEPASRGDILASGAGKIPKVAKAVRPAEAILTLPEKEAKNPDVLSNTERNSLSRDCIALIAKVGEGERTADYDELLEKALPTGKNLDSGRFNDRAATTSFFKTLSNDAKTYFASTSFENFAGAVILIDEKNGESGLGNPSFHSMKVTLQIRVVFVPSGRVVAMKDLESVGAGFTRHQALEEARSRIAFPTFELLRAL